MPYVDRLPTGPLAGLKHSGSKFDLLLGLVTMLHLVPIWTTKVLPLVDLPQHIARAFVLGNLDHIPLFRDSFERVLVPMPNVAIDLIGPLLLALFAHDVASKVFLTLTVLVFVIGTTTLIRSVSEHRNSVLILIAPFLFYSSMLLYGMLNYVLGLGLLLLMLGCWWKYRTEWTLARVIALSVLAVFSYLTHLSSIAFFGMVVLTVLVYEWWKTRQVSRDVLYDLVPFVIPALLFLFYLTSVASNAGMMAPPLSNKLTVLFTPLATYDHWFDAGILAVLGIVTWLTVVRAQRTYSPLWMVVALVFWLCYLLCPGTLLTSMGADARFIPPAYVFTMLAIRSRASSQLVRAGAFVIVVALSLRIVMITVEWHRISETLDSQMRLVERLPVGARIHTLLDHHKVVTNKRTRPMEFLPMYAMITRQAVVQSFFTISGQQPLARKCDSYELEPDVRVPQQVNWHELERHYDVVWEYEANSPLRRHLEAHYTMLDSAGGARVYSLQHPLRGRDVRETSLTSSE